MANQPKWKTEVAAAKDRADMLELALYDLLYGRVHWIKRNGNRVGVSLRSLPLIITDNGSGCVSVDSLHKWADRIAALPCISETHTARQLAIDALAYYRQQTTAA